MQNELFISRAELTDAQHSGLFDYYDLLAASGELGAMFGIADEKQVTVKLFE